MLPNLLHVNNIFSGFPFIVWDLPNLRNINKSFHSSKYILYKLKSSPSSFFLKCSGVSMPNKYLNTWASSKIPPTFDISFSSCMLTGYCFGLLY